MNEISAPIALRSPSKPYVRTHMLTVVAIFLLIGVAWFGGDAFIFAFGLASMVCNEIWALRMAVESKAC